MQSLYLTGDEMHIGLTQSDNKIHKVFITLLIFEERTQRCLPRPLAAK